MACLRDSWRTSLPASRPHRNPSRVLRPESVPSRIGDYEAAIGALERLLFYNPDLARVRYELGSLYYRLGSYEMAARYFKEALANPMLDRATQERIERTFLLLKSS